MDKIFAAKLIQVAHIGKRQKDQRLPEKKSLKLR